MLNRHVCRLLLGGVAALAACRPPPLKNHLPAPERMIAHAPSQIVTRTPSGLTVIVSASPEERLQYVHVRYRIGTRDDPPGQSGMAYLAARILTSIRAEVEQMGEVGPLDVADIVTSSTNDDETFIEFAGVDLDFDGIFALVAAQIELTCPAIRALDQAERRRVIRHYEGRRADTDLLTRRLMNGEQLLGSTTSLVAGLSEISAKSMCRFFREHIVAGSVSIAVTGGVEEEDIDLIARRWLVRIPRGTPPSRKKEIQRNPPEEVIPVLAPVASPRLVVAAARTSLGSDGASEVARWIVDEFSSTAFRSAHFDQDFWRHVSGQTTTAGGDTAVATFDAPSERDLRELFRYIRQSRPRRWGILVRDTGDHGVAKTKAEVFWSMLDDIEDPAARARLLAGLRDTEQPLHDAAETVWRSDTHAVMNEVVTVLRGETLHGWLLLPDGSLGESQVLGREQTQILPRGVRASQVVGKLHEYRPRQVSRFLDPDLEHQHVETTLSNGLRVVIVSMEGASRAHAHLVLPVGSDDSPGREAEFAIQRFSWPGPTRHDIEDGRSPEQFGISGLNTFIAPTFSILSVDGSSAYVDWLLGTLAHHSLRAEPDIFWDFSASMVDFFERTFAGDAPSLACKEALLGEQPVADLVHACRWKDEKSLRRQPTPSIRTSRKYRDEHFRPDGSTLLVVGGNFDTTLVLRYVEQYFGAETWPSSSSPRAPSAHPALSMDATSKRGRPACVVEESEKIDGLQLSLIFPLAPSRRASLGAILLLESVLASEFDPGEGGAGVHWLYSALNLDGDPHAMVHAYVTRERASNILPDLWTRIDTIDGDEWFAERFERAQRLVLHDLRRTREDPGAYAEFLAQRAIPAGHGASYVHELIEEVKFTEADELSALLKETLSRDRVSLVVRGGSDALREFPACNPATHHEILLPPVRWTPAERRRQERQLANYRAQVAKHRKGSRRRLNLPRSSGHPR